MGGSCDGRTLRDEQGDVLGRIGSRCEDGTRVRASGGSSPLGGCARRRVDSSHGKRLERKRHSFVQFYGTEALDAANLIIPMVGFLPPDHERVKGTIAAILRDLSSDDRELIYRYRNDDGLPGEEGVFSICTFWMAQALVLSGDEEQGERIFCRMLKNANHLGLYSEELEQATGAFAGNFPQGLTHIALINCALALAAVGRG